MNKKMKSDNIINLMEKNAIVK